MFVILLNQIYFLKIESIVIGSEAEAIVTKSNKYFLNIRILKGCFIYF